MRDAGLIISPVLDAAVSAVVASSRGTGELPPIYVGVFGVAMFLHAVQKTPKLCD